MFARPRLVIPHGRFSAVGIFAVCAFVMFSARAAADTSAAMMLADRYSPVIGLEPQPKLCGPGDFTNKHEGDWEMAQVDFAAPTPEQALKIGPYQVDYAQHAGGERAAWDGDLKLTKDGTHPLEYIVTGANAGFFQRKLYLG